MLIVDVNDQKVVADHVAALGVVPAANYLVMYKRTAGWIAMVGALNARDPSLLDKQLAANEDIYLLVFVDGNLILQNLEQRADNAPRELLGADLKDVGGDELKNQVQLHFVRGKKRENYYMFKNTKTPRYQDDNWAHLRSTHFNHLGTGNGGMHLSSARPATRKSQGVQVTTLPVGSRVAAKQAGAAAQTQQPMPVVRGEDIPASARPEREYRGLFGGGLRHRDKTVRATKEETYHVDPQTGKRQVSWLRRRLGKIPTWRIILYIGVFIFLGVSYTLENVGSHVITGTVIAKRFEAHSRRQDDRYVLVQLANGRKIEIENDDTMIHGKFNSDALQAKIKKGLRYRFETVGIANNDWISYNIVKMKLLK
jgi:hypothetical protein